jgi:threonine dehydratase
MTSQLIDRSVGCELIFKTENLQKIGPFKARGTCNALFSFKNGLYNAALSPIYRVTMAPP